MRYILLLLIALLLASCTEKPKASVRIDKDLQRPISCMKLNTFGVEKEFLDTLKNLYTFDETCPMVLNISYKKDIVCNSSYNALSKSTGKFPKSFLKLELRKGLKVVYSYYIDLLDNVESDDVRIGFERLKNDIVKNK